VTIVITLITCLVLLGSTTLTWAQESVVSRYFPLAVGNRWVYEIQDRMDGAPPAEEVWEVVREEHSAFVLRIRQSDLTTGGFEESFLPTTGGVKRIARETRDKDNPPFFLKEPFEAGTAWEDEDGVYEITATEKTVVVPAGSFSHCLEVTNQRRGGKATVVTLYAPGVGVVQREETYPILEGSGSFHPQRQDKAIMRLREWQSGMTMSRNRRSLDGAPLTIKKHSSAPTGRLFQAR
jgi:hypothetical protein